MTPTRKKALRMLAALLVAGLAGFRLCLPGLVRRRIDKALNGMEGYRGGVDKVRIHLWRGSYVLEGLRLEKAGKKAEPLFSAKTIAFSIAWGPLLSGNVSGRVEIDGPKVNLAASKSPEKQQAAEPSLKQRLEELFPLRIDRFTVRDGEIHFRNPDADPPVDVFLRRVSVAATNLTNDKSFYRTKLATVDVRATAMSSGRLEARLVLNPLADKAAFGAMLKLEGLNLPELNSYFRHYLAVEAKTGTLDFYLEGQAREGEFRGYAKPLLENLDLIKMKKHAGPLEALKAGLVKIVGYVMKNHKKDRLGSRIEIAGTVGKPEPDAWSAIASFFRNWLVEALKKGFET